jgi:hypothetical protein
MPGLPHPLPSPPRINLLKSPRPPPSINLFLLIPQTQLPIATAQPFHASTLSPSFAVFHPQRRRLHRPPHRPRWSKTGVTFKHSDSNSTRLLAVLLHLSLEVEATVLEAVGRCPPDAAGRLERLSPGTLRFYSLFDYVIVRYGTPFRVLLHRRNKRVKRSMGQIENLDESDRTMWTFH